MVATGVMMVLPGLMAMIPTATTPRLHEIAASCPNQVGDPRHRFGTAGITPARLN